MPKLYSQAVSGLATASTTFTPDLPAHRTGDLLLLAVGQDGGGTDITTATSGWTKHGTFAAAGGVRGGFFSKLAASGSETAPAFTGANDEWSVVAQAWDGCDGTTPVEAVSARVDWNNVNNFTAGSLTTLTNNAAVVHMCVGDGNAKAIPFDLGDAILDASAYPDTAATFALSVAHTYQATAGANTPFTWRPQIATEGGNAWAVALKPASSDRTGVRPNPSADYIEAGAASASGDLYATLEATNTGIASIAGINLSSATPTVSAQSALFPDSDTNQYNRTVQFTDTTDATGGLFSGPSFTFSAKNLSSKAVAFNWRVLNATTTTTVGTIGALFVFQDNAGAWSAFRRPLIGVGVSTGINYPYCITPSTATPDYSSGTMDWTNIVRIKMLVHRIGASQANTQIRGIAEYAQYGIRVTGGNSASPITLSEVYDAANNGTASQIGTRQGSGQVLLRQGLEIGDGGTTPTYFDAIGQSLEMPLPYDTAARVFDYRASAGFHGIRINPGASDTIRLRAAVVSTTQSAPFVFAGSALATVECDGLTLSGPWSPVCAAGLTISGVTFTGCNQIDGSSATYNSCLFRAANGAALITADDGAEFNGCNFRTDNAAKFAIEIDAAGTIDLNNCTFTGFTTDINVTATTGTVTLALGAGQATPTYQTAGATVVIDAVVLDTTWTNEDLADGTVVLVRNMDTSTTIDYATVSGGTGYTITLTPDVDYTVGDVIEVRQARKNGTTYYIERTSTIITTSGGGDLVEADPLAVCPICTGLGLDGEDYDAKFDLDSTDDELDIDTSGAWETGQLMTWWKWQMTLQAPMEEFWNAWAVQSDGSFRNDTSILPSKLDTTTTGDSVESTGRRVHRSDGSRPIKSPTTGGGTVDVSWRDPVTVVETGTSGLTPEETALLADIAPIKAKTDNLPATPASFNETIEGAYTAADVLRLQAAALAGKTTGQPGAPVFRAIDDSADRIAATVDGDGNRTSVTLTP